MHITLFLICCLIAYLCTYISEHAKKQLLKKSFKIYSFLFTITAITVIGFYIHENRSSLQAIYDTYRTMQTESGPDIEISQHSLQQSVQMDVPMIQQLPELPRGCEVTSLAMLLQYHDIDVDKMELAKKVRKSPETYRIKDGEIHFGNPYRGFVGDMYSFSTPGLGVYHGPIAELAFEYVGERVYDFTGADFSKVIEQLNKNRPVWVIINAAYDRLPKEAFQTWITEDGPMEITMREHSVLVTGYDEDYIYFNDPLNIESKAPIQSFQAAWEQMGKQAITIK